MIEPPLGGGRYATPSTVNVQSDAYGGSQAGSTDHGVAIFGALGEPLVAVADGTLFAVGLEPCGGNHLWLRDAPATSSTTATSRPSPQRP